MIIATISFFLEIVNFQKQAQRTCEQNNYLKYRPPIIGDGMVNAIWFERSIIALYGHFQQFDPTYLHH